MRHRKKEESQGCPLFFPECGTSCLEIRNIFKSSLSPKHVNSAEASPFPPYPRSILSPVSTSSLVPEPPHRGRKSRCLSQITEVMCIISVALQSMVPLLCCSPSVLRALPSPGKEVPGHPGYLSGFFSSSSQDISSLHPY